jgi:hypothetical protein
MQLSGVIIRVVVLGGIFTALWSLFLAGLIPDFEGARTSVPGLASRFRLPGSGRIRTPGEPPIRRVLGAATPTPRPAAFPQEFKIFISPRPSPSPEPEVYNLRNCECREDWKSLVGTEESLCTCGSTKCANKVTPRVRRGAGGRVGRTERGAAASRLPDRRVVGLGQTGTTTNVRHSA